MSLFIWLLTLLLVCNVSLSDDTITISTGEWPPYISKSLLHSGVVIKVINEAFSLEVIQTKIIFYPWSRAYQNAKKGIVDATAIWYHSQEREEHFHYSIPVVHNEYVFFHLANFDFNWNTINDLKDIKIGATLEYTYSDEFHKAFNDGWLDVQWVPTDLQNFKKLFLHRIELFPLEREPGYFLLNKHFTEKEINLITYHLSLITYHLSLITYHLSLITYHLSLITLNL